MDWDGATTGISVEEGKSIANLMNAIEQGIITTTTKQRMIELENTKEELELKIIKEEIKHPPLTKDGLIFWLQRFRSMEVTKKEHKQRLIDSFVNAVYVYDDKLVLTFNYNEANTTVTLDEVNGSIIECSGAPKQKHPKIPVSCGFSDVFFFRVFSVWSL